MNQLKAEILKWNFAHKFARPRFNSMLNDLEKVLNVYFKSRRKNPITIYDIYEDYTKIEVKSNQDFYNKKFDCVNALDAIDFTIEVLSRLEIVTPDITTVWMVRKNADNLFKKFYRRRIIKQLYDSLYIKGQKPIEEGNNNSLTKNQ